MDEIFDRIRNAIRRTTIKRKYLVASLIATEIFGILVLGWFLRKPIAEKYINSPPKAYSVVVMNAGKRYVVSNEDFLVGKTIPKTKVVALLTPGKIKQTILSDSQGEWRYQIPKDLEHKRYQFSVGYFDKTNKLAFFKTYKIRAQSNIGAFQWLNKINQFFSSSIKKAQAQEEGAEPETETVPDNSQEQVYPLPNSYNIAITSLGLNSDTLDQGRTIYPESMIYDQDGQWITEAEGLKVEYSIESESGESVQLTSGEDCQGVNACSRQFPENIALGGYNLIATLFAGSEPVAYSQRVSINLGQAPTDVVAETDSQQVQAETSCLDEVCSSQQGTTVARLDKLYDFEPIYDDLGQAMNIAGDCGEGCTRPVYVVESNYLQQDANLDQAAQFTESGQSDPLISCLKETQNNPTSILSLVTGVTALWNSFDNEPPSSENLTNTLADFLTRSSLTCSINDYADGSLPELNNSVGYFGNVELKTTDNFDSLESYYRSYRYPVIVGTHHQGQPHYAVVLAITDGYVWLADPLDVDSAHILRIRKDEFISKFYAGNYWEISPASQLPVSLKAPLKQGNLPIGHIFLRSNVPVYAYSLDENNAVSQKKQITSINDKFYILGKYDTNVYMYKINFFNREGDYVIPIRDTVLENGENIIESAPPSSSRSNFIGTRINPPFFYNDYSQELRSELFNREFSDLNKLGVGKVRIVVEDLADAHLNSIKPLIERAFNNGYFVLFQYKPGTRMSFEGENIRLTSFMRYIQGLGASSNNFAIELYNEPNLRHYWNECRTHSLDSEEAIRGENPNAVGWTRDENTNQMVYVRDCEYEESYAEALSMAIKQASDIIWGIDPDTKLIIGALSLQGARPPEGVTIQEEHQRLLDIYLGEIGKLNNLSNFDFAIHGYQVWDTGPQTHNDGSDNGPDGLLHVYNSLKNNQFFRQAKGGNCKCIWVTEFSVDQLGYDAYNLIRILENIKDTSASEGLINSVFIHEFNGVTENNELWQLWDNEVKYPAYNLVQYYLYQQFINY